MLADAYHDAAMGKNEMSRSRKGPARYKSLNNNNKSPPRRSQPKMKASLSALVDALRKLRKRNRLLQSNRMNNATRKNYERTVHRMR